MFPLKSPDELWSALPFTARRASHTQSTQEREDEFHEFSALFTRSEMSSVARPSLGPSLGFTEAVMSRVREEAQAQQKLASVSPLVAPVSFELTFERVREMARGVARSTWLLAAGLFVAGWLAILTSPLFGFGLLTTGAAALILHMSLLQRMVMIIAQILRSPEMTLALMMIPVALFIALIALIQRLFPRLALDLV
jgi:hypothetical protein